jgi:8-oxo-dGTP pyrophosphatase MutT (NUDIX family)
MITSQNYEKAALIPYYRYGNEIKMLFMKPSDPKFGGSNFQCCKGKIEAGFTSEQTAIKEAEEELGVTQDNIKNLEFLFYDVINYKDGRSSVVYVYTAEIIDPNKLIPFHYETGAIKWLNIREVSDELRLIQRNIVYKAYNRIQ